MMPASSQFNLAAAKQASEGGELESFVLTYLEGPGKNLAFADGLRLEKRWWRGPMRIDLKLLERTCGPEEDLPYPVPEDGWNLNLDLIARTFESLEEFPPLIVQYEPGHFYIRDGNHRYGAFHQLGLACCWAIIWYANQSDYEHHLSRRFRLTKCISNRLATSKQTWVT